VAEIEEPEAQGDQVATPPSGAGLLREVEAQGGQVTPERARVLVGEQLSLWEAVT
jgi:hypothetical protein